MSSNSLILLVTLPTIINSLCIRTSIPSFGSHSSVVCRSSKYGKGSEIWPECNEEPILLTSSFPNGSVPQPALDLMSSKTNSASNSVNSVGNSARNSMRSNSVNSVDINEVTGLGRKRRAVKQTKLTLARILQSAAMASQRRASASSSAEYFQTYGVPPPAIDKGPAIVAALLFMSRCVSWNHLGAALGLTTYFIALASWCAAPKARLATTAKPANNIVNMPSLPQKGGHLPNLIANPLGSSLTNSFAYRTWLRLGALLGLLLPLLAVAVYRCKFNDFLMAKLAGGPVFLLCCQALTEAFARTALLPLPIRILIPLSYNTVRLSALNEWAFRHIPATANLSDIVLQPSLRTPGRLLSILNVMYWHANLLGFLIPIAVIRYLRAHFYCVEAVEVTVREGGEGSVGLLP